MIPVIHLSNFHYLCDYDKTNSINNFNFPCIFQHFLVRLKTSKPHFFIHLKNNLSFDEQLPSMCMTPISMETNLLPYRKHTRKFSTLFSYLQ